MICKTIGFDELSRSERWRVEIFTDAINSDLSSMWPPRPMTELATESTDAIMPSAAEGSNILYVGLENVESITGEPVNLEIREKTDIRSRSKVFKTGQILYGRLRPYLRKAFLAGGPFAEGICSTEFIVISPNEKVILPQLLRVLLVSRAATDQFARFQIGAALPRISSKDFFSVSLPVPPLNIQKKWLAKATKLEREFRAARHLVSAYPLELESSVEELIAN